MPFLTQHENEDEEGRTRGVISAEETRAAMCYLHVHCIVGRVYIQSNPIDPDGEVTESS